MLIYTNINNNKKYKIMKQNFSRGEKISFSGGDYFLKLLPQGDSCFIETYFLNPTGKESTYWFSLLTQYVNKKSRRVDLSQNFKKMVQRHYSKIRAEQIRQKACLQEDVYQSTEIPLQIGFNLYRSWKKFESGLL